MSPADKREFYDALGPLFAAYGKRLDPEQADAYWRYLADLPLMSVLDGIAAAGRTAGRYAPSVGQIREAIQASEGGVRDTRRLPGCADCAEGWVTLARPIGPDESFGPYGPRGHAWVHHSVAPCTCPAGQAKRRSRERAA